ncbi:MAG: hypothetical protein HYS12_03930 [Planctomycetes bacterium]|nr:hypothetical protein [Planctomycetota bacterium]
MAKQPKEASTRSDAYTGMLILSLLALVVGCAFLYLDWSSYSSSKPPQLPKGLPQQAPSGAVPPAGQ